MRTLATAVIMFVVGAAATTYVFTQLRRADEVARKSGVDGPTAGIIVAINNDLRCNHIDQGHAKLRVLERKWLEYHDGGATPEMFYNEVLAARESDSQQSASLVLGSRGTPPANAGAAPQDPAGEP